jgi:hypothetical protein
MAELLALAREPLLIEISPPVIVALVAVKLVVAATVVPPSVVPLLAPLL